MATNDSISKETLKQIEMALSQIVSHAMSIRHLAVSTEDSSAGAEDVVAISANCGAVQALANQIGYLSEACAGHISGDASSRFNADYWFGISLKEMTKVEGGNHG